MQLQQQQQMRRRAAGSSASTRRRASLAPPRAPRGAAAFVVRAQIVANEAPAAAAAAPTPLQQPTLEPLPQLPPGHAALGEGQDVAAAGAGACPFLAALAEPPMVRMPLYKRFWQLTDPYRMQRELLEDAVKGGGTMVQVDKKLGFAASYVPGTADAVKTVFAGEAGSEPITRQAMIPSMVTLLGPDSLIFAADPRHKYLRGLLGPAFSDKAVASYLPQITELVGRHLSEWVAAGDGGVKGFNALKLLTFEFIVGLTFGRPYSRPELLALTDTYQRWTRGFAAWPWKAIPLTPFWSALRARRDMLQHFQEATTAGRAALARGEAVPGLLGNMLTAVDDDGNRLTDPEILDNILLLLLAGHDTSSTTLTRCFANLQEHPAVLQRLRDEQAAIVARHGEAITASALKDMTYADAVIRETLRLDPVVGGLMRAAARDFELSGFTVPAGKALLLPLKFLAANDGRWAGEAGELAPERFVPERMLTPEGQKAGDLLPFGYGPRYCLGASLAMVEMKVLLALVARQYSFTADTDTQWVQAIGRVPKNGLPMVVKPLAAA